MAPFPVQLRGKNPRSVYLLTLLFVLLAVIGTAAVLFFSAQMAQRATEEKAYLTMAELRAVRSALQAAETNQRAFLYTTKPEFLNTYRQQAGRSRWHLKQLEALADEMEQVTLLDTLKARATVFLALLDAEVNTFQRQQQSTQPPIWHLDQLDRLNEADSRLIDHEIARLKARAEQSQSSAMLTGAVGLLALGAAALLGTWVWLAYRRQRKHLRAHSEELETAQETIRDKALMLKEVNHRAKNNLTVINALLNVEAARATSEEVRKALRGSQSRVETIARIHEQLYRLESEAGLDTSVYVKGLVHSLNDLFAKEGRNIHMEVEAQPLPMEPEQAVPFGLILNELLTNVYRHAFNGRTEGRIKVRLWDDDGAIVLRVEDDGLGMTAEPDELGGFGTTMVKGMASQLGGELQVESTPNVGTVSTLRFPKR